MTTSNTLTSKKTILILTSVILILSSITFLGITETTGYFAYQPPAMIQFELNESWNVSSTIVRLTMDDNVKELPLGDFIAGNLVNIDDPGPFWHGDIRVEIIHEGNIEYRKEYHIK